MMAAFSPAIFSMVSPKILVCSSATPVMTATLGLHTLVASQRPPMPHSSTAQSTPSRANSHSAAAVSSSNSVPVTLAASAASSAASMPSANARSETTCPSISMRSGYLTRWGEV